MSQRSDTVTSEMQRQIEKVSAIKGSVLPSQKWDQYADNASSKIKISSKRRAEEEEISRGIVLVGKAREVRPVVVCPLCIFRTLITIRFSSMCWETQISHVDAGRFSMLTIIRLVYRCRRARVLDVHQLKTPNLQSMSSRTSPKAPTNQKRCILYMKPGPVPHSRFATISSRSSARGEPDGFRAGHDREDEPNASVDRPARQSHRTSAIPRHLVRLLHGVEGAFHAPAQAFSFIRACSRMYCTRARRYTATWLGCRN